VVVATEEAPLTPTQDANVVTAAQVENAENVVVATAEAPLPPPQYEKVDVATEEETPQIPLENEKVTVATEEETPQIPLENAIVDEVAATQETHQNEEPLPWDASQDTIMTEEARAEFVEQLELSSRTWSQLDQNLWEA